MLWYRGLFFQMLGLAPVKGILNASQYKDIFYSFMLKTLWKEFGNDPSCSKFFLTRYIWHAPLTDGLISS